MNSTRLQNLQNQSDNNAADDLYKLFGFRTATYLKQNCSIKMAMNSGTINRICFAKSPNLNSY